MTYACPLAKRGFGVTSSGTSKAPSNTGHLQLLSKQYALLVEFNGPWLHGELFADQELDLGKGRDFKLQICEKSP